MTDWKFADVYEAVAAKVPDRPCQITVLATYHSACKDPFATGTFAVTP